MSLQGTAHLQLVVFANRANILAVLDEGGIAGTFPVLPDLLLHLLNLLAHLLRLVLLVFFGFFAHVCCLLRELKKEKEKVCLCEKE